MYNESVTTWLCVGLGQRGDTLIRDRLIRDTLINDTLIRDTLISDTLIRDTLIRDSEKRTLTTHPAMKS